MMAPVKGLCLLGSTGEIGTRVLDVVRRLAGFRVVALAARSNAERMAAQVAEFRPARAILTDPAAARELRARLDGSRGTRVDDSAEAVLETVRSPETNVVFSAIAGAGGLQASVAAVAAGKVLALANKESIVMAGPLLTSLARRTGAAIIPVDSEHSAVLQASRAGRPEEIRRVILTGSGGPFRSLPAEALPLVTPEQALRHPTWEMGPKITIDSATLMNKALEILEACFLFGLAENKIEVVIHPQSIVHALVEFADGSMLAQMSRPDMRLPIQYALTYPDHSAPPAVEPLDLAALGRLDFEPPDLDRFPSIRFGYLAARMGGTAGACLNGADEVAVDAFLNGRIAFTDIFEAVGRTLEAHAAVSDPTLEDIIQADAWAREHAARTLGLQVRAG